MKFTIPISFLFLVVVPLTSSLNNRFKRQVNGTNLTVTATSTQTYFITTTSTTTVTTEKSTTIKTEFTTTHLTSKVSTTINTMTTTTTAKKQFPFQHVIGLLGPLEVVDVVFLMGRTKGIGKFKFYQKARQLSMALMKQYASVHPKYARLAYVTFASNSSIDYDDISNSITPLDKCQLFPSTRQQNLPLDKVVYIDEEENSADGINGAIQKANDIFQAGRNNRKTAHQILFIVTDADFKKISLINPDSSVTVFGVGLGTFYDALTLQGLVGDPMNMDTIAEWFKLTNTFLQPANYSNPLHVNNVEDSTCLSLNSPLVYNASSTDCFCDVDYGIVRLKCKQGFVDVFDVDSGNKRSCEDSTAFGLSCQTNQCVGYYCKRKAGLCDRNVIDCTQHCLSRSTCTETADFPFCRCYQGFYGPSCSLKENGCRFSNICMNNARCIEQSDSLFFCSCTMEYYGKTCEIRFKPTPKPDPRILNSPLSITAAVIASGIVSGIILLVIVVGITTCTAIHITRKKVQGKPYSTMKSEMGTSTETVSKWSIKNKNNLSVRLSKLWKQRSLRGFREKDGMPTVPWRTSTNLTGMELQSVDQEETIVENEIIHDNRPVMENWKIYLTELIENGHLTKGLMVNVFTKEIITTDDWEFNWSEVYTLDSVFGTETNVNIQNEDYFLKSPENGVACAKSGSQFSHDDQNLLVFAKTKKYLIAGIVALSDNQDGSECRKEIELIMNHVKSEGF